MEQENLPKIALPLGRSPAMIFPPSGDSSHIPGSLDLVAPLTEDLEIISRPLVTSNSDWSYVIQDVAMRGFLTLSGVEITNLLPAPGTFPSLLVPDKSPHDGDRVSHLEPVLHTTGSLAAYRMLVSRIEV
jgi:hypothetical protein